MNRSFNPDNRLWRFLSKLFDLFAVSCMWFLCSLPLITVGTASIALYSTVAHCLRGDETSIAKRFFGTFKKELIPGILITIFWAVLAVILWSGYQIVLEMGQSDPNGVFFVVVYTITLLIPVGILCWVFAIQSRFVYKFFQMHKIALYFTFAHLPNTVAVVALALVAVAICMVFPFLVVFVPGILVYFQSWFIERAFKKYIPKGESEEIPEEDAEPAEI